MPEVHILVQKAAEVPREGETLLFMILDIQYIFLFLVHPQVNYYIKHAIITIILAPLSPNLIKISNRFRKEIMGEL